MKILLSKDMGKMKAGETMYARTDEQAMDLVAAGFAEHLPNEEKAQTELILVRNPDGSYDTPRVPKKTQEKADTSIETATGKGETTTELVVTATALIEKIKAATTKEMAENLIAKDENRTTVLDAVKKKVAEFK